MQRKHIVIGGAITLIVLFFIVLFFPEKKPDMNLKETNSKPEKIQIRFMSSWAGFDSKSNKLQEILNKFETDHPDIEVIDESMSGDEFLFKLKTDFASGNDPDVFGLWPGSDIQNLISRGKIVDLTTVLENDPEWYDQFGDRGWELTKVDGKIYGLPFEIIYECLFINKDLFTEYDVKVPENYEELITAVKEFKAQGIIPIAYNVTPEGSFLYQNIVMKLSGKETLEKPFEENEAIHPYYIQGMKYMKELYDLGAFPKDAFSLSDSERNDLFINKKAAMIVQGTWFIGGDLVNPRDRTIDIVPFPAFEEGNAHPTSIIYGLGNGIFHMSTAAWNDEKKREACLELLKALTSQESAKIFANEAGFISNIKIPPGEIETNYLSGRGKVLVKNAKELIGPTDSFINRDYWEDIIVQQFPAVLEGEITPEEVIKQVEQKIDEKEND